MFEHLFCKDGERDHTYGFVKLTRLKMEPKRTQRKSNLDPSKTPETDPLSASFPSVVRLNLFGIVSKATKFSTKFSWDALN